MNLADIADNIFTLDLPKEELIQRGYSNQHIEAQYSLIKINELQNLTILKENSLSFDFASLKRKFDLIFIDGDHHWKFVKKDTENVFEHLVHENSIVVWHDYKINYSTIWWEVLYGILKGLNKNSLSHIYHVKNTNCLVYLPLRLILKLMKIHS